MKTFLLSVSAAAALALAFGTASVHSQAPAPGAAPQPRMIPGVTPLPAPGAVPAPAPAAAPAIPLPVQATPAAVLTQLRLVRDQNAKLIEQQAATLKQLEEMEKTSQTLKMLGKRS